MSFNGAGVYNLPTPAYPPVTGTKISSTNYQTIMSDIASALSLCLVRDGQAAMTGNLNMGTKRLINLADGATVTDGATKGQVDTVVANLYKNFTYVDPAVTTNWATLAPGGYRIGGDYTDSPTPGTAVYGLLLCFNTDTEIAPNNAGTTNWFHQEFWDSAGIRWQRFNALGAGWTAWKAGASTAFVETALSSAIQVAQGTKNKLINGRFFVDQRSVNAPHDINGNGVKASAWVADRWVVTVQNLIVNCQAVNTPGSERLVISNPSSTSTVNLWLEQKILAQNAAPFAGKKITVSFKIDTYGTNGATFTDGPRISLAYPSSPNAFGSWGATPSGAYTYDANTKYYSLTFTADAAAVNGMLVGVFFSGLGMNTTIPFNTINITDFQLELGGVRTDYEVKLYSDVWNTCRAYYKVNNGIAGAYTAANGSVSYITETLGIPMWTIPNVNYTASGGGGYSSVSISTITHDSFVVNITGSGTGAAAFNYSFTAEAEV